MLSQNSSYSINEINKGIHLYLTNLKFNIYNSNIEHFKEEKKIICESQSYSWKILLKFLNKYDEDAMKPIVSSFTLLSKSLNSLLASFELANQGYVDESGIVLRNILEIISVSYDIIVNKKRYQDFLSNDNFESSRSISVGKEIHKEIGLLYGMLTRGNVHIFRNNSIPNYVDTDGDNIKLFIGGEIPNKYSAYKRVRQSITLCTHISIMILAFTEYIFREFVDEFHMWKIKKDNSLEYFPKLSWFNKILTNFRKFR